MVAAAVLFVIASGQAGFDLQSGFASNGYGEHSPGKYSLGCGPGLRGRTDLHVPHRDPGCNPQARAGRIWRACHRTLPHPDPPDQHPGHQHVGESGAQHGAGVVRGWLGLVAALAVLAGTDRRRHHCGLDSRARCSTRRREFRSAASTAARGCRSSLRSVGRRAARAQRARRHCTVHGDAVADTIAERRCSSKSSPRIVRPRACDSRCACDPERREGRNPCQRHSVRLSGYAQYAVSACPLRGVTLAPPGPANVTGTDSLRRPTLRSTTKCRCGPLEKPVLPELAMYSPRATRCPICTRTVSSCRCA